jgi:SAM-dependent methyltransferase
MEEQEMEEAAEKELKQDPAYGYHESREKDSLSDLYSPYSDVTLPIDRIPEDITKRMVKVFSKHTVSEVREWGRLLMRNYQMLHAIEKPMNLQYVKPFANTSDLVNKTPYIHPSHAKQEAKKVESQKKVPEGEENGEAAKKEVEMEADQEGQAFQAKDTTKKSKSERNEESQKQEFVLEYQREHAIAYLYRKMPYHYMIFKQILSEVKVRMPKNFKPESVLDYGAGLGSGLWAGQHLFGDSIKRIAAVEPSTAMRKLGKYITEEINEKCNNSILWVDSLSMIPGIGGDKGKFDLVLVGYVLQEVPTARQRELLVEALWSRVREGGVMVLVEPGSPKGYRFINSFREWILAKDREEACLVAPCPHHKTCPMAANPEKWCHFSSLTQRLPKSVFPKLTKEQDIVNEKYSYIVAKKGKTPNVQY